MFYDHLCKTPILILICNHSHSDDMIPYDTAEFLSTNESALNLLCQCASAVDNLATYYFNNITVGDSPTTPAALKLTRHVADCPGVFPEVSSFFFG